MTRSLALVGATGGAGTTRLTVEMAATLARTGADVAVLDAALGTQGLARYVEGRIDPDLTSVLADDVAISEALYPVWSDLDGRAQIAPASAAFERLARAKRQAAAERFAVALDRTTRSADYVLLDVPPVADNPAVAAATDADHVAVVTPNDRRGADALPMLDGRLEDLGVHPEWVLANDGPATDADPLADADHVVPAGPPATGTPTALDPESEFATAVGDLTGAVLDVDVPTPETDSGLLG